MNDLAVLKILQEMQATQNGLLLLCQALVASHPDRAALLQAFNAHAALQQAARAASDRGAKPMPDQLSSVLDGWREAIGRVSDS